MFVMPSAHEKLAFEELGFKHPQSRVILLKWDLVF